MVVEAVNSNHEVADKTNKKYFSDYNYADPAISISRTDRPEYAHIVNWVEEKSKVLDLACGDGSLGERLIKEKGCEVWGIKVDKNGVDQAELKGIHAVHGDIDMGLNFPDKSFNYVIINVTLQMVYRPDFVLGEAVRVGRKVIVSFPNFAHIIARGEMMLIGRMPRSTLYGRNWYDTRHIHMFSYKDFKRYACPKKQRFFGLLRNCVPQTSEIGLTIERSTFLGLDSIRESALAAMMPNLFSGTCILMVSGNDENA